MKPRSPDSELDGLSRVIAANARALRAKQKRRQVDVAAAAGISRTVLSVIEGGGRRITVEDIAALCRGLGVSFPQLLQGADPHDRDALGV